MGVSLPRFCFHSTTGKALIAYIMLISFLNELVRFIPKYLAEPRERVVEESDEYGPVTFHLADGTTATVEAVIEADGFKSNIRQSILEFGNHESYACYS